ncbi:hypothetical protein M2451_000077 [Dysgonomonas sp. PFB1-18]|uniref:hypothetical protein n=1 Tax=unclassified Dysgonomonas TaxID=2630389 RepID=UPI002476034C|nr:MULTISPECIES: hypothetical protein [unclassified Dysgonomonas]MDH6307628.1 hypothetical protein [Dysgonomonas sp. PF1-14]MDH6337546.1 hypothetical protein [Dysgonomonas sp. PF1-16]MDH6378770.1 hypothetical protein [Dysgonomonas sp. PFB1-18]MDH6399188.1 hypothetical protein [Dysgonomonas sp. PF1-23]
MKTIKIIALLLLLPLACSAQLIGIGAQYADAKGKGNAIQFAANASFPVWHKKNPLNSYISSGIDYTGGSSPVAGLNIKPIQFTSFISESLFNDHPFTILVGCDAGYLFNFRHGKDGVVITPNAYFDYKGVFVKTGYDFNVTGGKQQFFVRLGFNFGIGTFKNFVKTKIW